MYLRHVLRSFGSACATHEPPRLGKFLVGNTGQDYVAAHHGHIDLCFKLPKEENKKIRFLQDGWSISIPMFIQSGPGRV